MRILRGAWLEARALHRRLWIAVSVGFAGWVLLVHVQQPEGDPFFWASIEAVWLLWLAMLPWLWLALRGNGATDWCLRASRQLGDGVLAAWLGVVGYGLFTTLLAITLLFTVYSIIGGHTLSPCLALGLESVLLLVPLAAFAPGVACLALPIHTSALVWTLLLGGCFVQGVPVPTGSLLILQGTDLNQDDFAASSALASLLATGGGLLFSVGLARRRLGHQTICASASSATFTATSKR